MRSLREGNVHVWLAKPEAIAEEQHVARCRAILSKKEEYRYGRYIFDRDRHLFLVAHALVRTSLSRYAAVAPAAWTFSLGPYGRPELAGAHGELGIRFNLSHTHGLAACAIGLQHDLGVDVEWLARQSETSSIAHRYFSKDEVAALRSLPPDKQRQRFFCYWTLKEAYIKARGMGLAIPLGSFSFELDRQAPMHDTIGIAFGEDLEDCPDAWRFHLRTLGPEHSHMMALARKAPARGPLKPLVWHTVPDPLPCTGP